MTTTSYEPEVTERIEGYINTVLIPIMVRQAGDSDKARDLIKLGSEIAAYTQLSDASISKKWEQIRSNESMLDYLLIVTQEFIFRMGGIASGPMRTLTQAFSDSFVYTLNEKSYMDATIRERALPEAQAEKFATDVIQRNIWFVVLILAGWVDIHRFHEMSQNYRRGVAAMNHTPSRT